MHGSLLEKRLYDVSHTALSNTAASLMQGLYSQHYNPPSPALLR